MFSIYEFDVANDLVELIRSIKFSPLPLGALAQFEDHGPRRFARQAALGPESAQTNRGEHALDGANRPTMFPVLGEEVAEYQQDDLDRRRPATAKTPRAAKIVAFSRSAYRHSDQSL